MSTKTQPNTLGDWLKWEQNNLYSRREITVLSGQNLKSGTVLGKVANGTASSAANAGNTGNGAMGAITVGAGAKPGVYRLTIIEPATNAGTFRVEDSDGVEIGTGNVAAAFNKGGLSFTLADGATDFVAGDGFTITVAAGSGKRKASPNAAQADGSEVVTGILLFDVDASSADAKGVEIYRDAIVSIAGLVYEATVDDDTKKGVKRTALEAMGITSRSAA